MLTKLSFRQRLALALVSLIVIGAYAALLWSEHTRDRVPTRNRASALTSATEAMPPVRPPSSVRPQVIARAPDVSPPNPVVTPRVARPDPAVNEAVSGDDFEAALDAAKPAPNRDDDAWFDDPDPRVVAELRGQQSTHWLLGLRHVSQRQRAQPHNDASER